MKLRYALSFLFLLIFSLSFGQTPEMADAFRQEGKIFVVVAIILMVLAGLIFYLVLLDRKLNKLQRELEEKKKTKSL